MPSSITTPRCTALSVYALITFWGSFALAQQPAAEAIPTPPAAYTADYLKWGSPKAVLTPDYPKALLEKRQGGVVEAVLEISPSGKMQKIVSITTDPSQPLLEASVREALPHWTFNRSLGPDCKPVAATSRLKVWFELKDAKPSISVSHVPPTLAPGAYRLDEINRAEVVKSVTENYPRLARMESNIADVLAKLTVEARTGVVKTVDITSVFSNEQPRRGVQMASRAPKVSQLFAATAHQGLLLARFEPLTNPSEELVHVCREVNFRLSGESND